MKPLLAIVLITYVGLLFALVVRGSRNNWRSSDQRALAWASIPGIFGFVFALGIYFSDSGDLKQNLASPAIAPTLKAAPSPSPDEIQSKLLADALTKPHYSVNDGEDYAYESQLTDSDATQGVKAKPMVLFRYLGRKAETYQVINIDGDTRHIFEVSKPFDFAKVHTFYKDRYQGKELLRLVDGTIAASAVRDAVLGHLKQWTRVENGVVTTFWVDGERKRLLVEEAAKSGVVR